MKKTLLMFIAMLFSINAHAQCDAHDLGWL